MSEITINTYEGMFLFSQSASSDLGGASQHVLDQLEKVGAEVVSFKKWDDRRLAYPIKGNKRGVYFLGFFKLAGDQMRMLERNLLLSEEVLRFLITRADHLTLEQMEAAEGREAIADEIKARSQQKSEDVEASVRVTTRADRESAEEDARAETETPETTETTEAPETTEVPVTSETPAEEAAPEEPAAS
jgi:small subunit ribosomal protein S6